MLLVGGASLKSKAVRKDKSWKPQIAPYAYHKWHTEAIHDTYLVRAQDVGTTLKLSVMLLFPFGDVPAERTARIDDTINRSCTKDHQKPHTPAIQAGFSVVAD